MSVAFLLMSDSVRENIRYLLLFSGKSLVPSLFPFIIASNIIMIGIADTNTTVKRLASVAMGLVFGFPIGALYASEMHKSGEIRENELLRMSSVSLPGIGFFYGVIADSVGIRNALLIHACCLYSGVLVHILLPGDKKIAVNSKTQANEISIMSSLSSSISSGSIKMLTVIGCVCFFGAIGITLSSHIENDIHAVLLSGFFEFGSGTRMALSLNHGIALPLTAAICSFSGISVFFQTMSCVGKTFSTFFPLKYLSAKALMALMSALLVKYFKYFANIPRSIAFSLSLLTLTLILSRLLQRINIKCLKKKAKYGIINIL